MQSKTTTKLRTAF